MPLIALLFVGAGGILWQSEKTIETTGNASLKIAGAALIGAGAWLLIKKA